MLLVALSWIYILFTTVSCGLLLCDIFKIRTNPIVVIFIGLFVTCLIGTFWALFYRINFEFHIFLVMLSIFTLYYKRDKLFSIWHRLRLQWQKMPRAIKIIIILNSILILAHCASSPFAFDNESYYIQSVKWLNEFGFVKGLANLHIFLAQSSGWSVVQSIFSFSFMYDRFNDINGFMLLAANLYSIFQLSKQLDNKQLPKLIIALFPLANLLLFPFISAPSPDLPIYILTVFIAYFVLCDSKNTSFETFQIVTIFALFAVFVKTTAFALVLIPVMLLVAYFRKYIRHIIQISIVAIVVLALFVAKNLIVSGYAFFPLNGLSINVDYRVPAAIAEHYYNVTKLYAYRIDTTTFQNSNSLDLALRWLTLPKLHGFFNGVGIILVLVLPFLILRYYNRKSIWLLYFVMIAQLLILLTSSPQYRFFLNFVIFFTLFIAALAIRNQPKIIYFLFYSSIAMLCFYVFVPMSLTSFTENKLTNATSTFHLKSLVIPAPNSRFPLTYKEAQIGNLKYNSPRELKYIYITGNGDLPCVKTSQIKYFKRKFEYIPQQRTTNLKDGFYAKSTK